jgi:hypothetical protein
VSIEQTDLIDIISIDRMTGQVVLTISDHLDWSDSAAHLLLLQSKLNRYLAFVESGELLQSYPNAKDRPITFIVTFKFPPDEERRRFLAKMRTIVESAGISLREKVSTGAPFNQEHSPARNELATGLDRRLTHPEAEQCSRSEFLWLRRDRTCRFFPRLFPSLGHLPPLRSGLDFDGSDHSFHNGEPASLRSHG